MTINRSGMFSSISSGIFTQWGGEDLRLIKEMYCFCSGPDFTFFPIVLNPGQTQKICRNEKSWITIHHYFQYKQLCAYAWVGEGGRTDTKWGNHHGVGRTCVHWEWSTKVRGVGDMGGSRPSTFFLSCKSPFLIFIHAASSRPQTHTLKFTDKHASKRAGQLY